MRISIYITKNDEAWLEELRKYAKDNHWSISLAIRELLKAMLDGSIPKTNKSEIEVPKETDDKIDPEVFFAQMEQKAREDLGIKQCQDSRRDKDGNVSCYFFDQARDKYSFCKQYCWTDKTIWKERVRL